jgi:phosphoglycolate phosphatase
VTLIRVGTSIFDIDAVVFDKDGLLFDSQHFWRGLAEIRIACLKKIEGFPLEAWCRHLGISRVAGKVVSINPTGIFAIASSQEEIIVTASLLHEVMDEEWGQCRRKAAEAFSQADDKLDILKVLHPKQGFPDIFRKLREAGVPYGIATSDDAERTRISIDAFDRFEHLRFLITPAEVKKGKPNPDMLLLVAEMMQVPPGRFLMIGDSYVDVQMAREAGSIGIGIPDEDWMREKMIPYASTIVSSLEEIEVIGGR